MSTIRTAALPPDSLLAQFGEAADYRDCFACEVEGHVPLSTFIEQFYCSWVFRPERLMLGMIGRGANNADANALANDKADGFAAWNVVSRTSNQILLRDFSGATASWLSVESIEGGKTCLLFGSWVGARPSRDGSGKRLTLTMRALMPFHRWYSRVLLGAVT